MAILSNNYFFPLLQLDLLALLLFAIWTDYRPRIPGGFSVVVKRGPESMTLLEKITGIVIAAIITIINKSVFDDNDSGWKHYSAVINGFDLVTIIYLCYVSSWAATKSLRSTRACRTNVSPICACTSSMFCPQQKSRAKRCATWHCCQLQSDVQKSSSPCENSDFA